MCDLLFLICVLLFGKTMFRKSCLVIELHLFYLCVSVKSLIYVFMITHGFVFVFLWLRVRVVDEEEGGEEAEARSLTVQDSSGKLRDSKGTVSGH